MRSFFSIVKFTVQDILRQKSFFVLLAIATGFVLLLRGCYKGSYTVNGQVLDNLTIAWHASIIAFHFVAAGGLLIAAILSMGTFRRDREDGSAQYILSKPIDRSVYALGRAFGLWIVSSGFMIVLHFAIFIITLVSAGGTMPGFLIASCVCFVNVLFMVLLVCFLSLFVPDFAAALLGLGVAAVSYVSDGVFALMQSSVVQTAVGSASAHVSAWRAAWPKVASLQYFSASLFDNSTFKAMGYVHPLVNMLCYVVIAGTCIIMVFRKREI
jgi:ABC-type transport system involved in multi-copper enzyme maturation permease subunit